MTDVAEFAVDINCDMGESYGAHRIGEDEAVMPWITSANVACGFHGGDPRTIARTVERARELSVRVGAHPSFPDLVGFGRRAMSLSAEEVRTDMLYQIGAVHALSRAADLPLQHVKPHGRLNNMAVEDRALAQAIVTAVQQFDPDLILISYGGELTRVAEDAGMIVAHEVYADRAYRSDGSLVPRGEPDAVIHEPERIVERAISMITSGQVIAATGETIAVKADTICVHGDTPGAAAVAEALRLGLEREGIAVRPLSELVWRRVRPAESSSPPQ